MPRGRTSRMTNVKSISVLGRTTGCVAGNE